MLRLILERYLSTHRGLYRVRRRRSAGATAQIWVNSDSNGSVVSRASSSRLLYRFVRRTSIRGCPRRYDSKKALGVLISVKFINDADSFLSVSSRRADGLEPRR